MKRLLIDYGATRCRYVVDDGSIREFATADQDLEAFIRKELAKDVAITAVHIAYAGQVVGGHVRSAPNIAADHTRLKTTIEALCKVSVKIENDLKCAALAEYHARSGAISLFAAYIGTGFGGAVVEEGKVVRGHGNMAGEIGHIPFKKAPFLCGCGKDDCVEIYCSGSALERWVAHYGLECPSTLEGIESCHDEKGALILQNFYSALSHALATAVTLFNPTYLVLGGSVVTKNPGLQRYVRENVDNYAFLPAAKDVTIETTQLNNGCLEGTKWL
jgi:glucokinase